MPQQVLQSFRKAVAITPSDATFLTDNAQSGVAGTGQGNPLYKAFTASGAGNIAFELTDGTSPIVAVVAGQLVPLNSVQRVKSTGTTATGIVGYA